MKDEAGILLNMSGAIETVEAELRPALEKVLSDVLAASAKGGTKRLKQQLKRLRAAAPKKEDIEFEFDVTNPEAVDWVKKHAADTVKNVSQTTREAIRDLVEDAFEEQFDVDDLAEKIEELIGDADRAETIARTETLRASNEGQSQLWDQAKDAGLLTGDEQQEWIVTPDDRLCPICEPMDGETVPLNGKFRLNTGEDVDSPPAHPNCRCTVALSV